MQQGPHQGPLLCEVGLDENPASSRQSRFNAKKPPKNLRRAQCLNCKLIVNTMAPLASWLAAAAATATLNMQQGHRSLQQGSTPVVPMQPISTFGQQLMYGQLNTSAGAAYTVLVGFFETRPRRTVREMSAFSVQGTRRINVQFDVESGNPAFAHMHLGFDPYVAASQPGFLQDVLGVSAAALHQSTVQADSSQSKSETEK